MSAPNYRVLLSYDSERRVFHARAPELEHCAAEGATRAEAIQKVEEEIAAQVQNMLASGQHAPQPLDERSHSGEIQLKVSKQLHRDLEWQARQEGVDVGQLAGEMLAAAMAERRAVRAPRGQRPQHDGQPHDNVGNSFGNGNSHGGGGRRGGGFGGGRYSQNQHLLEDRANFIEYVRGLENQGATSHHAGPHGGPGHGGPNNRNRRRRGGGGPGGNHGGNGNNRGNHGGGHGGHGGGSPGNGGGNPGNGGGNPGNGG